MPHPADHDRRAALCTYPPPSPSSDGEVASAASILISASLRLSKREVIGGLPCFARLDQEISRASSSCSGLMTEFVNHRSWMHRCMRDSEDVGLDTVSAVGPSIS